MISISEAERLSLSSKIQLLEGINLNYLNSTDASLRMIHKEEIDEFRCIRIPSEVIYEVSKALSFILGNENDMRWSEIRANFNRSLLKRLAKLHENYIMTEDVKEKIYPILYESGIDSDILISNSLLIYKLYLWADNFCKFHENKQVLERLKLQLSGIEGKR